MIVEGKNKVNAYGGFCHMANSGGNYTAIPRFHSEPSGDQTLLLKKLSHFNISLCSRLTRFRANLKVVGLCIWSIPKWEFVFLLSCLAVARYNTLYHKILWFSGLTSDLVCFNIQSEFAFVINAVPMPSWFCASSFFLVIFLVQGYLGKSEFFPSIRKSKKNKNMKKKMSLLQGLTDRNQTTCSVPSFSIY